MQGSVVAVVADPDLRLEEHLLAGDARAADAFSDLTLVAVGSGRVDMTVAEAQGILDRGGGEYRMLGRTVVVTITYKHRLVPWSVLEGRLRALFGSGSRMLPVREQSTAGTARLAQGRGDGRRHPRRRRHPHRRRRLEPPRR